MSKFRVFQRITEGFRFSVWRKSRSPQHATTVQYHSLTFSCRSFCTSSHSYQPAGPNHGLTQSQRWLSSVDQKTVKEGRTNFKKSFFTSCNHEQENWKRTVELTPPPARSLDWVVHYKFCLTVQDKQLNIKRSQRPILCIRIQYGLIKPGVSSLDSQNSTSFVLAENMDKDV